VNYPFKSQQYKSEEQNHDASSCLCDRCFFALPSDRFDNVHEKKTSTGWSGLYELMLADVSWWIQLESLISTMFLVIVLHV